MENVPVEMHTLYKEKSSYEFHVIIFFVLTKSIIYDKNKIYSWDESNAHQSDGRKVPKQGGNSGMKQLYDVLIIGGGVVGSAIAREIFSLIVSVSNRL